ncbi:hypothetical protein M9Y10_030041 [Tritrichomonas musculus]|uniref:Uncharacterized protein n=1 Tax=Tritrichomonas musculus TaxID=1915356 RepID=A0ABR2KP76_9EUKA
MTIISYSPSETEVYTKLQTDVLNHKMKYSYAATVSKFGFSNNRQLEEFLIRTLLGFRMETIESASGPIPLVPDVVTKEFISHCIANANDLNCILTHKALCTSLRKNYQIEHLGDTV